MRKSVFYSEKRGNHTFLLVSAIVPIVALFFASLTTFSTFIVFPFWTLWLAYIFSAKSGLSKDENVFVRVSFLLLCLIMLYKFSGYSVMDMGYLIRAVNWILAGVVSVYAMKFFASRELSIVYFVLNFALLGLLLFFIGTGRAIMALEEQEEAATVTSAWYGSMYMLLTGISLIVFLHVRKLFVRLIALLFFALTLYLNIFIMQRGTIVIFTLVEIGLILVFLLKSQSLIISSSVALVGIAIYVISTDLLVDVFDWLAAVIPSERLASRFSEISVALEYEDINASRGSLSSRSDLIGVSWHTFISNVGYFLFGAGEHVKDNTIIGHHCFFVDTLARYGIIGGILVFLYFKKQFQIIMTYLDKKTDWALYMQCTIVFLLYLLRNFYGDMATDIVNFFILLYLPLTFQVILHYSNKQNRFKI